MAEDKKTETKVEEKKETEKVDEVKDTPENKEAIVKPEDKVIEEEKRDKKESEPAITKVDKKKGKEKKGEAKVKLEREYIVPLRKGFMNVPHYRRAKKAVKILKQFMVRHMGIRDGDTRKIKVDIHLNNEIWFRGIKKPLNKVKVKAVKIGDIVNVSLADPADYVKFKMAREEKAKKASEAGKKSKTAKKEKVDSDKNKDGINDKKEEIEDEKAGAEKAAKVAKVETKIEKHTVQGKHSQKVAPVRKVLK